MCLIYSSKEYYFIIVDDREAHVDVRHDWLDKYYNHTHSFMKV